MPTRGRLLAGAVVASVAVVIAGISFAAIPGADGTIRGCFNKKTKVLRVINAEAGKTCKTAENPLSWNVEGPPALMVRLGSRALPVHLEALAQPEIRRSA